MQAQLVAAQEELAATTVEGTAGGVTVTLNGTGELTGGARSRPAPSTAPTPTPCRPGRPGRRGLPRRQGQADALAAQALGPLAGGGLGGPGGAEPGRPACQAASVYEGVLQDLIDELGRLPGVGPKSAQRIAFHLLAADPADVRRLADALRRGEGARPSSARSAATSPRRSCAGSAATRGATRRLICVVEEPKDVVAIERTREFRGRYHVLGGAISPLEGIGPEQLRIRELMARLADGTVTEIILATDPNIEGDATAAYLSRMLDGRWTCA